MKIIISHDIDHLTAWEHWSDLMVPKFCLRACIECGLGIISGGELLQRLGRTATGRWENIRELMAFDAAHQVPSTFFIGMHKGRQLSYSFEKALQWGKTIHANGFELGVHGIEFRSPDGIRAEFNRFRQGSGVDDFGVRMHCLARDENTLERLAIAGYRFDSSVMGIEKPYRVGKLWEIPLQVMDGDIMCAGRRRQSLDLAQAKVATLQIFSRAVEHNLPYFNVLFHDIYYCEGFKTWKHWYQWLIQFFKGEGYGFISFSQAVAELEEREALTAAAAGTGNPLSQRTAAASETPYRQQWRINARTFHRNRRQLPLSPGHHPRFQVPAGLRPVSHGQ